MNNKYLIGIDIGVSLVKAGIYDLNGTCIYTVSKSSPGEYPKPNVFIQKNEDYFRVVIDTLKETVKGADVNSANIEAVSVSSAMGGATGIDQNGDVVFDWSIVSDTRYLPYVQEMQKEAGDSLLKLSGTNFPIFGPKLLWWKKENRNQFEKVKKFIFLNGYIVGKLCGLSIDEYFTDRTFLQMSSLADIYNTTWSDEICSRFNLQTNLLPKIVDSNTIVGRLTKKYAGILGLKAGTPFAAGGGDKSVGCLGAGMVDPGILVDESASFGALSLCANEFIPDEKYKTLENMPAPIPGLYYPCFFLFGSGVTHTWFKNNFGGDCLNRAEETGDSPFIYLDEQAKEIPPGSEGLLALGLFGGRGYPSDPDIRGMWIGHSWSHKKEHFYRSLLESFAYEYGCVLDVMRKTYPGVSMNEVRIIGGGARSSFWTQIKTDVLGIPYTTLNREDVALLGNILLAGSAVGIYNDIKEKAREFAKTGNRYIPDKNINSYYKKYMKIYSSVFDKVRDIFVDLENIPDYSL